MPEKRTQPRFGPLVLKARVEVDGQSFEGYLTNVSVGGAFLAIGVPPSIDAEISLSAGLPWNLGELRTRARVVWRNDAASSEDPHSPITGVGLAFTTMEAGSEEALNAYLQRFAELAAELDESPATHDGH
jgi:hypothetical protein